MSSELVYIFLWFPISEHRLWFPISEHRWQNDGRTNIFKKGRRFVRTKWDTDETDRKTGWPIEGQRVSLVSLKGRRKKGSFGLKTVHTIKSTQPIGSPTTILMLRIPWHGKMMIRSKIAIFSNNSTQMLNTKSVWQLYLMRYYVLLVQNMGPAPPPAPQPPHKLPLSVTSSLIQSSHEISFTWPSDNILNGQWGIGFTLFQLTSSR